MTAKEAMQHPYFDPVRDRIEKSLEEQYGSGDGLADICEEDDEGADDNGEGVGIGDEEDDKATKESDGNANEGEVGNEALVEIKPVAEQEENQNSAQLLKGKKRIIGVMKHYVEDDEGADDSNESKNSDNEIEMNSDQDKNIDNDPIDAVN